MAHEQGALPPAPEASTSKAFEWSCKCLNVTLSGLVDASERSTSDTQSGEGNAGDSKGKRKRVWLAKDGEHIIHPVYVVLKQSSNTGDKLWKRCCVCSTRTYMPLDKNPPKDGYEGWVEVDLGAVLHGVELKAAREKRRLPLSDLLLDVPTPSTFGRPPPNIPTPSPASTSQAIVSLLPPMPDPFFLPPPFVPAHPHLHSLILHALDQLRASRAKLEKDVTTYVESKTREMQQEEDRIRAEVEHLWNAYQKGPGKKEKEKDIKPPTRRGSLAPEPEASSSGQATPQPARTVMPPHTAGLLGASLSANSFHAPSPNAEPYNASELPDIDIAKANVGSGSIDDQNMAVSLMISHLEQQRLGNVATERVTPGRNASKGRRSVSRERPPVVNTVEEEDETDGVQDSWIGLEKEQARAAHEGERTPRAMENKELKQHDKHHDKPKTVKFQEPTKSAEEPASNGAPSAEMASTDADDQVFDFEEHDKPAPVPVRAAEPDSRARSELDDKLSSTLAVDMPSHRSAWRRIEQSQSIYDSFRSRTDGDARRRDADEDSDSSDIDETPKNPSMFATSMPLQIALPKRAGQQKPDQLALQRKTSLTERPGLLVPALLAAMREKPARGNVLGLNVPEPEPQEATPERHDSRSASTSRDRSQSVSGTFKQDPGAVFEAMADDEDEDEVGEIDDTSTRPGRPNFVPPHIQSLQDDVADSMIGWRSLAT